MFEDRYKFFGGDGGLILDIASKEVVGVKFFGSGGSRHMGCEGILKLAVG